MAQEVAISTPVFPAISKIIWNKKQAVRYNEPQKLDQVIWKNFWGSV
ncbi:hypothetical protein [Mycoplasmopsis arginini]|nr:hypothetical protein [Mycoplasmopsis arginini]